MRLEHSFDWNGFFSFLVILLAVGAVGVGGEYALTGTQDSKEAEVARTIPLDSPARAVRPTLPVRPEQRTINSLSIADAVPTEGKFIAADLKNMKVILYENGTSTAEYPILKKGKPGTPWETPSGFYSIKFKTINHFSSIGRVYMPHSMQFYGNYFIHGPTYYPDGTPTSASFSGGCIRLGDEDAERVFDFATVGTKVFVYDPKQQSPNSPLTLDSVALPTIDADAFIVADIDTGDVYAEKRAHDQLPIHSATKLMTALVANETISLETKIAVPEGSLLIPPTASSTELKTFYANDLFYPLIMQSSDRVASELAGYYGTKSFVNWMNMTARALQMASTTFTDVSGSSPDTLSTSEDLFRLGSYLATKKSFVLKIAEANSKVITADDGTEYTIQNTNTATGTTLSIITLSKSDESRRVAVVVLNAKDAALATEQLSEWVAKATKSASAQTACASCALRQLRRISL